ncbi:hypothetical protein EPN29_01175 [bacterium]|nr:MAG: hypothetical protein EPN29_01175 [bacterium]
MGSIAVFGAAGQVGSGVLRTLAAAPDVTRLDAFDVKSGPLEIEATDAAMIAEKLRAQSLQMGVGVVDMSDEEQLAQTLVDAQPDVIVQAAIPRSWYSFSQILSPAMWQRVNTEVRMGPWLPLFLVLPFRLMRARKLAGLTTPVVQISYPDVVNAVLGAMGMAPACGAGNSENIATVMRLVAARRLCLPTKDVTVALVAHHFHAWSLVSQEDDHERRVERPFRFRIHAHQVDVTADLDTRDFWAEVKGHYPHKRPLFAATSAAKNVLRILRDDRSLSHVSSPAGRGAGFDTRLGRKGAEVVLPPQMSEAEADALIAKAQAGDGIERIEAGGAVRFTDVAYEAMKGVLGYDCRVLAPDEIVGRADELVARLESARK